MKPRVCSDCRHYRNPVYAITPQCNFKQSIIDRSPFSFCVIERDPLRSCGPEGKNWEPIYTWLDFVFILAVLAGVAIMTGRAL